jgi:hypothetical protein
MREVLLSKNLEFISSLEAELKLAPAAIGSTKAARVDRILSSRSGRTASGGSNLSGRGEELDRKMGIVSPSDARPQLVGSTCICPTQAALQAQRARLYGS